jgi:pyruvate formate lyase activating enzyme
VVNAEASRRRESLKALIFDIERFAVHDGPGIRTLIFFKGCPLRCLWCCNPESQAGIIEILYSKQKCILCGKCKIVCPADAIEFSPSMGYTINREKCLVGCSLCAQSCPSTAKEVCGRYVTIEEVMNEIKRDSVFYREGGGVTLSGGEPLIQVAFAKKLLSMCKNIGIHTAIETSGHIPWENFDAILPYTDLFYYDLKIMDRKMHKKYTGVSNEIILENLRELSKRSTKIIVRIPLIPTINDSSENFRAIGAFIAPLKASIQEIQVLPYHSLGAPKYEKLGRKYELENIQPPDLESLERCSSILRQYGIKTRIGGQ